MDRELFVKTMNNLQTLLCKCDDIEEYTNGTININNLGGFNETIMSLIELLEVLMCDISDDIKYFIFELNFGENYRDGDVLSEDGAVVDFSTVEKLYSYLANRRVIMAAEKDAKIRSTPVN